MFTELNVSEHVQTQQDFLTHNFFFFFFFFFNPLNLFSHARDQLRPISTNQTKIHLKQMKTPDWIVVY